jgi:hypothetical protein
VISSGREAGPGSRLVDDLRTGVSGLLQFFGAGLGTNDEHLRLARNRVRHDGPCLGQKFLQLFPNGASEASDHNRLALK